MLCSICIATYKRPELLNKLLDSLIIQRLDNSIELEVIIIDNDKALSAKKIYDKFKNNSRIHFYYNMQPVKNISLTRNMAVKKAKGDYLLFIDDDEYAEKDWVNKLIKSVRKYSADGTFGRVLSYFDSNTPKWIKRCYVYHRSQNPTGSPPVQLNSGNCIIESSLLKSLKTPFDENYGISGGSDTQLFNKLKLNGANFVSCKDAITYEYVPPARAKVIWLIKRVFRTGNNYSRTLIELSQNKFITRAKELVYGCPQSVVAFLLALIFIWNRNKSFEWFLKSISNIGKIFAVFGYYPREYK